MSNIEFVERLVNTEYVPLPEALQTVAWHLPGLVAENNSVGRFLAEAIIAGKEPYPMAVEAFHLFFARRNLGDNHWENLSLRLLKPAQYRDIPPHWSLQMSNGMKSGTLFVAWQGLADKDLQTVQQSDSIYVHAQDKYSFNLTSMGIASPLGKNERGYFKIEDTSYMATHPLSQTRDITIENGVAQFDYIDLNYQGEVMSQEHVELPLAVNPVFAH